MKRIVILTLFPALVLLQSCSNFSLERMGYDTLQNLGHEQCDTNLSSRCPEQVSYDDYQRRRAALQPSK